MIGAGGIGVKLLLMVFGLTVFPGMVHILQGIFTDSDISVRAFYAGFYPSLLDMGTQGIIAWCIACGPYMVHEIYGLVRGRRRVEKSME
jgi:hypothetical protein